MKNKRMRRVYVISPLAGDIEKNRAAAIGYCKFVISEGYMPIASHVFYPPMLNDNIPEERELGTSFGLTLLADCDEAWCFGKRVTGGMAAELEEAKRLDIPIKYIKEVENYGA